jgi:hypothetical protein
MSLRIQDPFDPNTKFLLEAVLEACNDSSEGAGAFAFASAAGVKLLVNDPTFEKFISQGAFKLVVGLDSITNIAALEVLYNASQQYEKLDAKAFHHNKKALFHPKVCWFKKPDGKGTLIAGSGNLTVGGLKGNWEAFSIYALDAAEMADVEKQWQAWLGQNVACIKELKDPAVIARASQNAAFRRALAATAPADTTPAEEAAAEAVAEAEVEEGNAIPYVGDQVLLATIPDNGNRWKQANFTRDNFHSFFGVDPGTQQRVSLYHQPAVGSLGEVESRPVVSVKSNNHRLELGAAAGLEYPTSDRPIGVFLRVATRTFHYMLLMPGEAHHQKVKSILVGKYSAQANQLPRTVMKVEDLQPLWPESPLWQAD